MRRWRLLVGLALAALVATVSAPMLSPRIDRCDVAAWASLRSIWSAETAFQREKRVDLDRDGTGEFGFLAELAGVATLTGGEGPLDEPYLGTGFRAPRPDGTVSRSGYRFRVHLPDAKGNGIAEPGQPRDPALAARRWCAYAWPADHGNTGNLTLFIDQDGNVLCTDDPRYSGDRGPEPGAAYTSGGLPAITGIARAGAVAQDGNAWRPFETP